MPASDTYVRSASVALPPADRCRASVVALACVLVVIVAYWFCPSASAQTSDSRTAEEPTKSWTSTTNLKGNNVNSERIIESHSQTGNRTLEERSVEIRGSNGHFEPYQYIEKETLQVDTTTMRTTTRMFGRDVNGRKTLVQVVEQETHTLPGGDSDVIRITSNPDVNGKLQPVQRKTMETKRVSTEVEETNATVMLPSANGGLAPASKTHAIRKRAANDTVETETTTWLLDVNGKWQLSEIRKNTTTQEAKDRRIEERVFRSDAEGKLGEVSHVVSQDSESTSGEKRSVVETYSIDVPGSSQDGSLHLIERKTSTDSSSSTGERATELKVEQTNPGDPGAGLHVSVLVDGRMVPGPSGDQSTVTVRARDVNGSFAIVSVETMGSDKISTIQVQQTPAEKP
jgi:hypothetical protein